MMPHCKRDSQFELFESPAHDAHATPRLELPFQRSQEIDMRRAAKILGVAKSAVYSMLKQGLLVNYRIPGGSGFRIEYDSVVAYCNDLRLHFRIGEDRLLRKPAHGRLRDEDLLPFPLADTIYAKEVEERLSIRRRSVIYMVEQGDLVGYRLMLDRTCPYRIYRPSLERYIASLHVQAQHGKLPESFSREASRTARSAKVLS